MVDFVFVIIILIIFSFSNFDKITKIRGLLCECEMQFSVSHKQVLQCTRIIYAACL